MRAWKCGEPDLKLETFKQRLIDPAIDGLWMRQHLLPQFLDGNTPARPIAPPPGAPPARIGAVLVLLYLHENRVYLPLTVRTTALRNHSGEISLPGGSFDAGDGDLQRTALREAWEELAIPPDQVTIWAQLTPVWIPVSNFQITPFVGWSAQRPTFAPAAGEVAELIEAPLDVLQQPGIVQREEREIRGQRMLIPYFALDDHKVWGATSMILAELVGKLQQEK